MKVERIIILEGPNGFGKTTTAKYLYNTYNIPYIHFPLFKVHPDNPSMYIKEMLYVMDQLDLGEWFGEPIDNKVVVFDRFFLSTIVYNNNVSPKFITHLFKQWKDLYYFVVGIGGKYKADEIKNYLADYNYELVKTSDEMSEVAKKKILEVINQ